MKWIAVFLAAWATVSVAAPMPDPETKEGVAYYAAFGAAVYEMGACEHLFPDFDSSEFLNSIVSVDLDEAAEPQRRVVAMVLEMYASGRADAKRLNYDEETCALHLKLAVDNIDSKTPDSAK